MTTQAWSTRSSVPWEQGDIKSSGSHDPPQCFSPFRKNHQLSWGWIRADYPRQGSSVTWGRRAQLYPKPWDLAAFLRVHTTSL